jgi:hypothetical protein
MDFSFTAVYTHLLFRSGPAQADIETKDGPLTIQPISMPV